jgi:hypothetical protein
LGLLGSQHPVPENRADRPLIPVLGFGSLLLADPTVNPRVADSDIFDGQIIHPV